MICTCGHTVDEHGLDDVDPTDTSCWHLTGEPIRVTSSSGITTISDVCPCPTYTPTTARPDHVDPRIWYGPRPRILPMHGA